MTPVLLDTGVIVALLDRRERHHRQCVELCSGLRRAFATCEAVIAESCYLLRSLSGAQEAVLDNVRSGTFLLPLQLSQSATAVRDLLRRYRNVPAGLADACLIHLADQLGTGDILSLDSDFEVYRWRRNCAFHNLVEL